MSQSPMQNSRRHFLKKGAGVFGAIIALPAMLKLFVSSAQAEEKRRGGGAAPAAGAGGGDLALPYVVPGTGMAASLHYQNKWSDVKDPALKIERSGVPWGKQQCQNCMLYTKVGNKDGGEVGKCSIFAGQLVHKDAWCGSWSKKA